MSSIYVVSRDGQSLEKYFPKTLYAVVGSYSYSKVVRTGMYTSESKMFISDVVIGSSDHDGTAREMAAAAEFASIEKARQTVASHNPGDAVSPAFRLAKRIMEGLGPSYTVVDLRANPVFGWYVDHTPVAYLLEKCGEEYRYHSADWMAAFLDQRGGALAAPLTTSGMK